MKFKILTLLFLGVFLSLSACSDERGEQAEEVEPAVQEEEKTQPEEQSPAKNRKDYTNSQWLEEGQQVVSAAFAVLSSRLKSAFQSGGVQKAVRYCNLNAYPLIDSLSKAHDAQIRRVSFKVRNPKDTPDRYEEKALERAQKIHEQGERIQPWVEHYPGEAAYYAPIYLISNCLKCHGTPGETIAPEDYKLIKELYPKDQAIGYKEGDWRGLWSIRFAE